MYLEDTTCSDLSDERMYNQTYLRRAIVALPDQSKILEVDGLLPRASSDLIETGQYVRIFFLFQMILAGIFADIGDESKITRHQLMRHNNGW